MALVPRLRRAERGEAGVIAVLFRNVRATSLPYLRESHTPADDHRFFADRVLVECAVRVAEDDSGLTGFCASRVGWVEHLYVRPDRQGRGIGTALLSEAQAAWPRLQLWVFQRNAAALRFYAARGFREVERTDGAGNAEREPDVRMEWIRAG